LDDLSSSYRNAVWMTCPRAIGMLFGWLVLELSECYTCVYPCSSELQAIPTVDNEMPIVSD